MGLCLEQPNLKTSFFICLCSQLAASLDKIGYVSAEPNLKTSFFICLCSQLAVSLDKIGYASAKQIQASLIVFHLSCTIFAGK